jgi:hypothetical protein
LRNASDLIPVSTCFSIPVSFPSLCFIISTIKFCLHLLPFPSPLSFSNSTLLLDLISETPEVFRFRLCHLVLIACFFCVNGQFATVFLCFILATILT